MNERAEVTYYGLVPVVLRQAQGKAALGSYPPGYIKELDTPETKIS
jgi:hypothetical protein